MIGARHAFPLGPDGSAKIDEMKCSKCGAGYADFIDGNVNYICPENLLQEKIDLLVAGTRLPFDEELTRRIFDGYEKVGGRVALLLSSKGVDPKLDTPASRNIANAFAIFGQPDIRHTLLPNPPEEG